MSESRAVLGMPRLDLVVLDCPDPRALGEFYARMLGWDVVDADDDWVTVRPAAREQGLAFQRVENHQPPTWPEGPRPQQFHLDFDVHDIDEVQERVVAAGATVHEHQPSESGSFRVFLDPAGHPFCLCQG
jgi:predicted enzyme related to lactoylglutathione lyase